MLDAVRRWLSRSARESSLPQLLMRFPTEAKLPELEIFEPYRLRAYEKGDIPAWVALLNASGELGYWDENKVRDELEGSVVAGMQFFVVVGNQPVALASVNDKSIDGALCWEIGWVATHPLHRGKGLGTLVTVAALRAARSLPSRPILLQTDDFRLAAIRTYLKVGFEPTADHPSYPERWRCLFERLPEAYRSFDPGFQR